VLDLNRCARHQKRLQWADVFQLDRAAKTITKCLIIPNLILIVIIPDGIHTILEQHITNILLPPLDHSGVGEIQMRAIPIPKIVQSCLPGM